MGMLKRKEEPSATLAWRVPASLKAEFEDLRKRADTAGFDLTATITEALVRMARQLRSELDAADRASNATTDRGMKVNGLAAG